MTVWAWLSVSTLLPPSHLTGMPPSCSRGHEICWMKLNLPTCFKGRLPVTDLDTFFSDSCTGLKNVVMAMLKVVMGESCDLDVWVSMEIM